MSCSVGTGFLLVFHVWNCLSSQYLPCRHCLHKTFSMQCSKKVRPCNKWLCKICVAQVRSMQNFTQFSSKNGYCCNNAPFKDIFCGKFCKFSRFLCDFLIRWTTSWQIYCKSQCSALLNAQSKNCQTKN